MLKGIHPLLNADVLYALRAMGHGDYLVLSDTNFPSDSIARQTTLGTLLRMDNCTSAEAAAAVLSVMVPTTLGLFLLGRNRTLFDSYGWSRKMVPEPLALVKSTVLLAAATGRPGVTVTELAVNPSSA